MLQYLKRRWRYMTARLESRFEEKADPKVQLEQAMEEAKQQHRRLKDQAAAVIANQKQTEMDLARAISGLERLHRNARQAVMMAEWAASAGDMAKVDTLTRTAENFATQMINQEEQIDTLKSLHLQATAAAADAKTAVAQNKRMMQEKLLERQKLMGQLDQARMQERMNDALSALSESVGEVPAFDEVRAKIEARYAKAKGVAELSDADSTEAMLEVEAAVRDKEAKARLDSIRAHLGLEPASTPEAITSVTETVAIPADGAENPATSAPASTRLPSQPAAPSQPAT